MLSSPADARDTTAGSSQPGNTSRSRDEHQDHFGATKTLSLYQDADYVKEAVLIAYNLYRTVRKWHCRNKTRSSAMTT